MFLLSASTQHITQSYDDVFEDISFPLIIYPLQSEEIVTFISLSLNKVLSYSEETICQRKT